MKVILVMKRVKEIDRFDRAVTTPFCIAKNAKMANKKINKAFSKMGPMEATFTSFSKRTMKLEE